MTNNRKGKRRIYTNPRCDCGICGRCTRKKHRAGPRCDCGACVHCRRRAQAREYQRNYRKNNPEASKAAHEKYIQSEHGKAAIKESQKKHNTSAARKEWKKAYRKSPEVRAKEREYQREYLSRPEIRARHNENRREYLNERYRNDLEFRLRVVLRTRLRHAIRRVRLDPSYDSPSAVLDLGCTIPELIKHIESQFVDGMTWDNWTRVDMHEDAWNIDHIIPLTKIDLTDPEAVKKAVHYTNLAPMRAVANICKSNILPTVL